MATLEATTLLYTWPPALKASLSPSSEDPALGTKFDMIFSPRSGTSGTKILRVERHVIPLHPPSRPKSSQDQVQKAKVVNRESIMIEEEEKTENTRRK